MMQFHLNSQIPRGQLLAVKENIQEATVCWTPANRKRKIATDTNDHIVDISICLLLLIMVLKYIGNLPYHFLRLSKRRYRFCARKKENHARLRRWLRRKEFPFPRVCGRSQYFNLSYQRKPKNHSPTVPFAFGLPRCARAPVLCLDSSSSAAANAPDLHKGSIYPDFAGYRQRQWELGSINASKYTSLRRKVWSY